MIKPARQLLLFCGGDIDYRIIGQVKIGEVIMGFAPNDAFDLNYFEAFYKRKHNFMQLLVTGTNFSIRLALLASPSAADKSKIKQAFIRFS